MTMSFVDIKGSHNLQDNIFNDIQRRKPRLTVKLKGTWQRAVTFCGCVFRSTKLEWFAFNLKSLYNLFYEYWWYQRYFLIIMKMFLGWINMF